MGKEIERKFLVKNEEYKKLAQGDMYRQGYLSRVQECTVRVRVTGKKAFLTVKGAARGITRAEYEYAIPLDDGNDMLDHLSEKPLIEKKRYKIPQGKFIWEVDEFSGENQGLVVAEIELESEDESFDKPAWVGEEVTGNPLYFNSNLVKNPFGKWHK